MYLTLKTIHVSFVIISIVGFILRSILVYRESPILQRRWIRILPHVNDTLLLASALAMVVMSAQYPFVAGWLTAKVFGLLAYIVLGVFALRGRTAIIRRHAFFAALATFGWIVSVALIRHPAGIFSLLLA